MELGTVSAWNGFWVVRKRPDGWESIPLECDNAPLPDHVQAEVDAARLRIVEETKEFNLIESGDGYLALAKSLGRMEPFVERVGERELRPLVLLGASLEELRCKVWATEIEASRSEHEPPSASLSG